MAADLDTATRREAVAKRSQTRQSNTHAKLKGGAREGGKGMSLARARKAEHVTPYTYTLVLRLSREMGLWDVDVARFERECFALRRARVVSSAADVDSLHRVRRG